MEGIDQRLEKLIRIKGDKVMIDTLDCTIWQQEHTECFGCPSETGCHKLVKLKIIYLNIVLYEPKSFSDYQKANYRLDELITKVLEAKTKEEVDSIPDV